MRKIPTVFRRDPENMKRVLPEIVEGCEWVLDGEGVATRKYDGTCVMFDGSLWWARREVKPGKPEPAFFLKVEADENTGKTVGWEPVEQSGFAKWHADALDNMAADQPDPFEVGTYELCGPKVQGNPEGYEGHVLIFHEDAALVLGIPRDFDGLRAVLPGLAYEGIVWHHEDGRMAKLKRRDFA